MRCWFCEQRNAVAMELLMILFLGRQGPRPYYEKGILIECSNRLTRFQRTC
jgi:hypothetical protein